MAENKYKKGKNKQTKVGCSTNGTIEKETKCYELWRCLSKTPRHFFLSVAQVTSFKQLGWG